MPSFRCERQSLWARKRRGKIFAVKIYV